MFTNYFKNYKKNPNHQPSKISKKSGDSPQIKIKYMGGTLNLSKYINYIGVMHYLINKKIRHISSLRFQKHNLLMFSKNKDLKTLEEHYSQLKRQLLETHRKKIQKLQNTHTKEIKELQRQIMLHISDIEVIHNKNSLTLNDDMQKLKQV